MAKNKINISSKFICERNKAHIKLVELKRFVTAAASIVKRMEKNTLTMKPVYNIIIQICIVTKEKKMRLNRNIQIKYSNENIFAIK